MRVNYLAGEDGTIIALDGADGFLLLEDAYTLADQIEIRFPKTEVDEETTHTATVNFRSRTTKEASTPTTIHYRVDNVSTKQNIRPWTAVTPVLAEVEITLTPSDNAVENRCTKRERHQLLVKADDGLSTQQVAKADWWVRNYYGIG